AINSRETIRKACLLDSARMMHDFTLVIETDGCAQWLAGLLSYLEAEKADCRVLVLDSTRVEMPALKRARGATSRLDVEFAEFSDLDPAEKRRQGINNVTTRFCALCASDDLVILEGLRGCLDALRGNPAASVAVGACFTFLPRPDGEIELNGVQLGATINDASPLKRLDRLLQQYQAPSYGVFRFRVLQRILDALGRMTKPF